MFWIKPLIRCMQRVEFFLISHYLCSSWFLSILTFHVHAKKVMISCQLWKENAQIIILSRYLWIYFSKILPSKWWQKALYFCCCILLWIWPTSTPFTSLFGPLSINHLHQQMDGWPEFSACSAIYHWSWLGHGNLLMFIKYFSVCSATWTIWSVTHLINIVFYFTFNVPYKYIKTEELSNWWGAWD